MKYTTVSSLCEGIAESIRRKEGSTEKINPQDFVQRIDNLQVGGGTSESSIEYLDVSGMGEGKDLIVLFAGLLCKSEGVISTPLSVIISGDQADLTKLYDVRAIMADLSLEIYVFNQKTTIQEFLGKEILDSIPRLTKEQFYTLE